ncbi:hypothetical protein COD67_03990 [Bacillus cereus]|nr:hypothetical protein COI89_22450 [Bacillus cereus]PGU69805.1 hypothetical protein COD67_03990 [Bacillus cereus]
MIGPVFFGNGVTSVSKEITREIEIEYKDVIDYWEKFFPELKNNLSINELLQNTSGKKFETLEEEWEKSLEKNIDILNMIDEILNYKYDSELTSIFHTLPHEQFPYLNFSKPIILYILSKVKEQFESIEIINDTNQFYKSIITSSYRLSYKIFFRTLILETNIAKAQGKLKDVTPGGRFRYYNLELLNDVEYLKAIYYEYESLTSLLFSSITDHINYVLEILKSTTIHKLNLEKTFNNSQNIGEIVDISTSAGDSHAGGKTVAVISFSNGLRLVYKPRNMLLEKGFNKLISYINNETNFLTLQYANVYTSGDYGWMEYIDFKICGNENEVENFYERIGQFLCILYSLNAKDFHHENLIASGEHPYLIDLEALLHIGKQELDETSVNDIATNLISESVYSIYLLPTRTMFNEESSEINILDIGGTGANTRQISPFKAVKIINNNTDNIKLDKDYSIVEIENNNPQLNNDIIDSKNYIENIQNGFSKMYLWIQNNKQTYSSYISKLFSETTCRVICKPTFMYGKLLSSSFHPDLLRKQIHRDVYFNRIGLGEFIKEPGDIPKNEFLDLLKGDIPYFSVNANEKELINSQNKKVEGFILREAPLEGVLKKINNFSARDLKQQINIIDFTFMHNAKDEGLNQTNIKFSKLDEKNLMELHKESYLETAIKIGDNILENSIQNINQTQRTWLGLMINGKNEVFTRLSSVGHDIYTGNSGIALYFAQLASITGIDRFKQAAIESITPCFELINSLKEHQHISLDIGAFTGISGVLYSIFHIGDLLDIKEFKNIAYDNVKHLVRNIEKQNKFELISGVSGALGVIISLYEKTEDLKLREMLLENATILTEYILNNSTKYDDRCIFWGPLEETEGYTGFAHGTSGITTNLIRFYNINKDPKILETIKKALNFEKMLFSDENQNWKMSLAKGSRTVAWCHGASGILLNRILLRKFGYPDNNLLRDIDVAVNTTIEKGFGSSHILCHGDTGNLGILYQVADVLEDEELKKYCDFTFTELYNKYIKYNWDKNAYRTVNIYGLMVGLAGLGYSLLKYGCKYDIPDVLWLE